MVAVADGIVVEDVELVVRAIVDVDDVVLEVETVVDVDVVLDVETLVDVVALPAVTVKGELGAGAPPSEQFGAISHTSAVTGTLTAG